MGVFWGPQKWWLDKQPQITGLVLHLDAGNLASYNPNITTSDLLLHLNGANNSTTFTDSGKNSLTITHTGGSKISTTKYKFSGSSLYLDGSSKLSFSPITLTGDFTIDLWFNADDITMDMALLGSVNGNNYQLLRLNADNVAGGILSYAGDYIFAPNSNDASFLVSNQWYHIALTRSNGVVRTFIDGQQVQINNNFTGTVIVDVIGAGYLGNSNYFKGYIDEVNIIDGTCLYTQNFTPPVSEYSAENSTTTWYDLSGNGNNGTLVNGVSYDSANQGSLVFDGNNDYVSLGTPASLTGLQVPITITGWVKPTSFAYLHTVYGAYASASGGQIYDLVRFDQQYLRFYTSDSTGNYQFNPGGTLTGNQNAWNFFAIVVSGTLSSPTVKVYLNNGSETFSYGQLYSNPDLNVDLRIGANGGPAEFFIGNISVLKVYNRSLNDQEITQEYDAIKGRYGL